MFALFHRCERRKWVFASLVNVGDKALVCFAMKANQMPVARHVCIGSDERVQQFVYILTIIRKHLVGTDAS